MSGGGRSRRCVFTIYMILASDAASRKKKTLHQRTAVLGEAVVDSDFIGQQSPTENIKLSFYCSRFNFSTIFGCDVELSPITRVRYVSSLETRDLPQPE